MQTPLVTPAADSPQVDQTAMGGGLEGAERTTRETVLWTPSMASPDQVLNPVKPLADARGRDMVRNDGYAHGVTSLYKDNIVGSQFRLNANPDLVILGADEAWSEEFQRVVEAKFHAIGESDACWLDASERLPFTMMVRLAVSSVVISGEVLATAEWLKDRNRPANTALQLISPDRLSNPNGMSDERDLRAGIRKDKYGRAVAYHIRAGFPTDPYMDADSFTWREVPAKKPWGRRQVIHIHDPLFTEQSRGVSNMVSVLKQMRMTKQFQDVTLQNAVVNASFAAAIESDLPSAEAFATIGAGNASGVTGGMADYLSSYMGMLASYLTSAKNIALDGAKIPHLFPGTKLNLLPAGTPGGVGTAFEQSLLRHVAAALDLSYEELSRDYTQTNYSSSRASGNNTWKAMESKKRNIADRFANAIYQLWLEEAVSRGEVPLPPGKGRDWFYTPGVKDALSRCSWIGAGRGQVDELKETQAAIMRIKSNTSTLESECARLGRDWREVLTQRARENRLMASLGVEMVLDASRTNTAATNGPAAGTGSGEKDDEVDE